MFQVQVRSCEDFDQEVYTPCSDVSGVCRWSYCWCIQLQSHEVWADGIN